MKHLSGTFLVRGFHCDSYGHVNHSRYFEFMEEARWQLLSEPQLATFIKQSKLQFFIVQINMSFKLPLMPGDEFNIETSFLSHTRKSITLQQDIIKKEGAKSNSAQVTFVLFDASEQRAVTIDEDKLRLFKSVEDD